jgi:hypothetical protein
MPSRSSSVGWKRAPDLSVPNQESGLVRARAPIEVLVIDSIERPTED